MHRSGTTLLAKVLEKGGIFMGVFKDHNFESIPFLAENQNALKRSNVSWLDPKIPMKKDWTKYSAKEMHQVHFQINGILQKLRVKLHSPMWGFKDPRNTFTLKMWLAIFPNGRVIHVTRNQKEVALSLQKRNQRKGEVFHQELESLEFNNQLWQQYIDQGKSYKEELGPRYLEIKYEEMIQFDPSAIRRLEDFTKCSLLQHFKYFVR